VIGLNGPEVAAVVCFVVAASFALYRLWAWALAGDDLRPLRRNERELAALKRAADRANGSIWEARR
jgi:hypothetical protein